MPRDPIHLHPTTTLAERVLLPGDPGRALLLAQELLEAPKMFNHHRGLWGYTGAAKADGEPMTIQATGLGGPSAALVLGTLCDLGATRFVRAGTCRSSSLAVGTVVVADAVRGEDGTSAALGGGPELTPDPALRARLEGDAAGTVISRDVFSVDHGFATDLSSAALLAVGAARDVAVAVVLGVVPDDAPLGEEEAQRLSERVGHAALPALL